MTSTAAHISGLRHRPGSAASPQASDHPSSHTAPSQPFKLSEAVPQALPPPATTLTASALAELQSLAEPEVHFIGELQGATNVNADNCFCWYQIVTGGNTTTNDDEYWTLVEGQSTGQTQVDYPSNGSYFYPQGTAYRQTFVWNHPLDLHYYTRSISGWPRIVVELYKLDSHGQHHVLGYGFAYLPSACGSHELTVQCWRPMGGSKEEFINFFLPNVPSLTSTALVHNPVVAKNDRPLLYTQNVGAVQLQIDVVLRNLTTKSVDPGFQLAG